ncbi:hypothetical protein MTR67_008926 [Solanum verrucosum]|uniref:Uncharacterized protein n=1 Tax=Solanum verrucosum TaxID=315347 RepID=A0AAF0Q2G2_SOLVR|nr:hypothetical protein MTR67_008926 [Solanum verrucosum]
MKFTIESRKKVKELAFVAGICPTVGVGGHFRGGGYGMMSRKFDKVDDNLLLRIFLRNSEFPFGGGQRTIPFSLQCSLGDPGTRIDERRLHRDELD